MIFDYIFADETTLFKMGNEVFQQLQGYICDRHHTTKYL